MKPLYYRVWLFWFGLFVSSVTLVFCLASDILFVHCLILFVFLTLRLLSDLDLFALRLSIALTCHYWMHQRRASRRNGSEAQCGHGRGQKCLCVRGRCSLRGGDCCCGPQWQRGSDTSGWLNVCNPKRIKYTIENIIYNIRKWYNNKTAIAAYLIYYSITITIIYSAIITISTHGIISTFGTKIKRFPKMYLNQCHRPSTLQNNKLYFYSMYFNSIYYHRIWDKRIGQMLLEPSESEGQSERQKQRNIVSESP